jgi:Flp pilus assembly protein CpaB
VIGRRWVRRFGGGWTLAAVLLALLSMVIAGRVAAGGAPAAEPVLVAAEDLPAGTDLEQAESAGQIAPARAGGLGGVGGVLRSPEELHGRRSVAPIAAGELITEAAAGGSSGSALPVLDAGERAVAIPAQAVGATSAALRVGSRVDVYMARLEGPSARSELVVRAAEVMALGAADVEDPSLTLPGGVLVRVDEAAAVRLVDALNFARDVRLVVRGDAAMELGIP